MWYIECKKNENIKTQLKEALGINALHTCVYIYVCQLSSFRVPTLWFINLTVTIFNTLFSPENGQNMKIL